MLDSIGIFISAQDFNNQNSLIEISDAIRAAKIKLLF